jgi:hypothetical protein
LKFQMIATRKKSCSADLSVLLRGRSLYRSDYEQIVVTIMHQNDHTMRFLSFRQNRSKIGLNSLWKWICFDRVMANA